MLFEAGVGSGEIAFELDLAGIHGDARAGRLGGIHGTQDFGAGSSGRLNLPPTHMRDRSVAPLPCQRARKLAAVVLPLFPAAASARCSRGSQPRSQRQAIACGVPGTSHAYVSSGMSVDRAGPGSGKDRDSAVSGAAGGNVVFAAAADECFPAGLRGGDAADRALAFPPKHASAPSIADFSLRPFPSTGPARVALPLWAATATGSSCLVSGSVSRQMPSRSPGQQRQPGTAGAWGASSLEPHLSEIAGPAAVDNMD